jgi:hypothetical protein
MTYAYRAVLDYCETFCERFLTAAFTIWRTNARLKRTFNFEGGKRDT